jgi:hypothetical protein
MAPLAVDPAAVDSAGAEVVTAGEGLGSVISTLTAALSGCSGMAGDDPAGAAFGHSYDGSAAKLVQAMAATRNGLCSIGDGVRTSAHNYSLAEAQSNISGHGSPLPTPPVTGPISAGSPASSVGTGDGAPAGWGWVAPYIGMIWPTADSGKLRAAATAWSTAGTQFGLAEILGTGGPMEAIRAQQIPEGQAIDRAFTDAYTSTTGIVQQCQKIAAQLNSYAAKVDKVHAAILDLLARICDPMTGIKEVWEFLTDEDEDEIKKIANDIRTVVDNFKSEVNALAAEIAATLGEAEAILTTMGNYATKQWDQFLHGTDVGRAINQVGQYAKGMWSEAGEFAEGVWDISSVRMLVDPIGYGKDLAGMAEGAAPLVGLGPDGGPGWQEAWKDLGKNVVHWDMWKTNPAEALGRSVFDVGTLALPGGPLSKVGTKGRALLDALKDLKKPPIPKVPDPPPVKPPVTPPVEAPRAEPPPPRAQPPEPGRPAPAPPGKPGPGPGNGPLPHSPTESKPPVVEKPATGEPPKPTTVPPGSAGKPPVAVPAEPAPAPHPRGSAPVPAAVPASVPASPGGVPAEPIPTAAAPSAAAPSASAPSASAPSIPSMPEPPTPPTVPAGTHAGETPPPAGGAPHGGEPGPHPPEPPHDGTPPPPGDGTGPHPPGDGTPHQPGNGTPPEDPADADHPSHPTPSDLQPWHQAQLARAESPEQLVRDLMEHGCPREIAESALHGPYDGMTAQDVLNKFWDPLKNTWDWPKHDGFADGKWETARSIPTDVRLDRIGEVSDERGDFMGAAGDSYPQRSLAPGASGDYHAFHGTGKQLPEGWEVRYGKVGEAFGQPGGGTQWIVVDNNKKIVLIKWLIENGYLDWG